MGTAFSQLKYTGAAPGADSSTYVLFNSVTATFPERAFGLWGVHKFCLDLKCNQAGTLNWYKSDDRGVNWRQMGTLAVAAPAATDSVLAEFFVASERDFKLEWVNGGSAQTTWFLDMSLSDDRAAL
jgi:hypothetical protein